MSTVENNQPTKNRRKSKFENEPPDTILYDVDSWLNQFVLRNEEVKSRELEKRFKRLQECITKVDDAAKMLFDSLIDLEGEVERIPYTINSDDKIPKYEHTANSLNLQKRLLEPLFSIDMLLNCRRPGHVDGLGKFMHPSLARIKNNLLLWFRIDESLEKFAPPKRVKPTRPGPGDRALFHLCVDVFKWQLADGKLKENITPARIHHLILSRAENRGIELDSYYTEQPLPGETGGFRGLIKKYIQKARIRFFM